MLSLSCIKWTTHKMVLNSKSFRGSTHPQNWPLLFIMQTNQPMNEVPLPSFFICLFSTPISAVFLYSGKLVLFVHRFSVISLSPPNTQAAWSLHYSFYLWLGILLKKVNEVCRVLVFAVSFPSKTCRNRRFCLHKHTLIFLKKKGSLQWQSKGWLHES